MTATDQRRAFLQAILDAPADDTPRLVYADWLDEFGGERGAPQAELIRVQCALATGHANLHKGNPAEQTSVCESCADYYPFRLRERELLAWASDFLVPAGWVALRDDDEMMRRSACFRRGFAADVVCKLADWMQAGPQMVRRHPVERVEADVQLYGPVEGGTLVGYYFYCRRDLPPEIWDAITSGQMSQEATVPFPTADEAKAALSQACLSWARSVKP